MCIRDSQEPESLARCIARGSEAEDADSRRGVRSSLAECQRVHALPRKSFTHARPAKWPLLQRCGPSAATSEPLRWPTWDEAASRRSGAVWSAQRPPGWHEPNENMDPPWSGTHLSGDEEKTHSGRMHQNAEKPITSKGLEGQGASGRESCHMTKAASSG